MFILCSEIMILISDAQIMQTERRTTSLLDCYAEVQLI